MLKALIYTDLQATEGSEKCFNQPDLSLQRWRVDTFYAKLRNLYHELGCNALWDLGDTTDDRTAIPIPALRSVRRGLKPFAEDPHNLKKYNLKLTGNHEQYTRNTEIDNSDLFSDIFRVVQGVEVFEFEEVAVIACSFPASQTQMAEQIQSEMLRYRRKPIIVIGHLEISGTRMKSGTSLTGMPIELFAPAQLVLLGHIHLPQKLGDNIYYVGSPFQQDFGEAGESKRVGLLTIEGTSISLDWIALDGFPEYRHVTLAEFESSFDPLAEDRYNVKIASPDEATTFYKHLHSARVRADYDYQTLLTQIPDQAAAQKDWSLDAAVKRWVACSDLSAKNISVTPEELTEFGLQIAEGELLR